MARNGLAAVAPQLCVLLLQALTPGTLAQQQQQQQPTGLMTDYQAGEALGVSSKPLFSWIVPACGSTASRPIQVAYRITVAAEYISGGSVLYSGIWDSGRITSNASTNAVYAGPTLAPGQVYSWEVTTWTVSLGEAADKGCKSAPSAPAMFTTALFAGWDSSARWIWTPLVLPKSTRFAFFR